MTNKTTALIDMSAMLWRFYKAKNENPSAAVLGLIQGIQGFDSVKICIDCPPYSRKEIDPEYKANRPKKTPEEIQMIKDCIEGILNDGWSVLSCAGAEADDVIATYCKQNWETEAISIHGVDKDLLQIDFPDVVLYDYFSRKTKTAMDTLSVPASQVVDCLALMGDASDNVNGLTGCGEKTAAAMLAKFGSIDNIIIAAAKTPEKFTEKTIANIINDTEQILLAQRLVKLDYDLDFVEEKRENKKAEEFKTEAPNVEDLEYREIVTSPAAPIVVVEPTIIEPPTVAIEPVRREAITHRNSLEPSSVKELHYVSQVLFESGLYPNIRTPQAAFAIIMKGRVLGIDAAIALEAMHVIKEKVCLPASLMIGIVRRSPVCEYIQCVERNEQQATWITKRIEHKEETTFTFTRADAEKAKLINNDNYQKRAPTMYQWRAGSELCRMEYSDVIHGLYSIEEMQD